MLTGYNCPYSNLPTSIFISSCQCVKVNAGPTDYHKCTSVTVGLVIIVL